MSLGWKDKKDFIRHLKDRRLELGLSQETLSLDLGMSRGYMFQVETGRLFPGVEVLGELARIFNEDPEGYLSFRIRRKQRALNHLVGLLSNKTLAESGDIDARPVPIISLELPRRFRGMWSLSFW